MTRENFSEDLSQRMDRLLQEYRSEKAQYEEADSIVVDSRRYPEEGQEDFVISNAEDDREDAKQNMNRLGKELWQILTASGDQLTQNQRSAIQKIPSA